MVVLTVTPFRGNHARFYPFSGHLGHTEVIVQGVLRTELEEDRRPLKASRVVVRMRCYEAENLGGKVKRKRMHLLYEREAELPVWTKPEDQDYADLGQHVHPFRIVIPPDNTGVSTSTYKSYRAWWQLEAIVYHKASSIHGSRKLVTFQMPLTRHILSPSPLPALAWSSALTSMSPFPSTSSSSSASSIARHLQYDVTLISTSSPGPDEGLEFAIHLRRDDPNLSVRKVVLTLDRHLIIDPLHLSPNASDEEGEVVFDQAAERDGSSPPFGSIVLPANEEGYLPTPGPGRASARVMASVFSKRSASQGRSPLPSPVHTSTTDPGSYFAALPTPAASTPGSTTSTPTSVTSTSSGRHAEKITMLSVEMENVNWEGENRLVVPVPRDRSAYRYSMGETMRTRYIDVHFNIAIKILLRHRNGAYETVELEPKAVRILGATLEDREKARALYGRVLAVADAEVRVCDTTGLGHLIVSSSTPSTGSRPLSRRPSPPVASLGSRRASNFTLTVSTDQRPIAAPPLASPSATAGPLDSKRRNSWFEPRSLSVRRRSEQGDAPVGAPARSRARFGTSPSPPSSASMALSPSQDQAGSGYVSSGLSRPPLGRDYSPATPTSPDFIITPTPSTFADAVARADHEQAHRSGAFPLATPPSGLLGHPSFEHPSPRFSRRSGGLGHRVSPRDGSYPYSFANRPRSAGALSIISQRSTISSQDSVRSFASGSSASTGYQRESSAPLPSSSCSTLMLLLNEEELPSLSLEPTIRATRIPGEPIQQLPADENTDFISGILPVPFINSPAESPASLASLPEPEAFPFDAAPSPPPELTPYSTSSRRTDDEDEYLSSAPSTPYLGEEAPSPAIDFHAFSLSARLASSSSPFASTEPRPSTDVDPATRAQIAPWSVTEDVSPFDVAPGKCEGPKRSPARGTTTTWNSSAWTPPRTASSSMARAHSNSKIHATADHLGVASEAGPRRKSSAGFALFGRGENDDGHESPGKEGSRWGFLRRGSRA